MAATRYASAAPLVLLLGGCVFIDDFDKFRADGVSDGGSDDGGGEGDADVEPMGDGGHDDGGSPRDGGRDADAGRDAQGDARTDGQTPSDAGGNPRDAGNPNTEDGDTEPPPDSGQPAPGCSSASITPTLACYPDRDGDRFADLTAQPLLACSCPDSYLSVPSPGTAQNDCWDDPNTHGADAFPGQQLFFPTGYGIGSNSYDYDCDGIETKKGKAIASQCAGLLGLLCSSTEGYSRDTECGKSGEYVICGPVGLNCGVASMDPIFQTCR